MRFDKIQQNKLEALQNIEEKYEYIIRD
jgi:hypothetical protein